MFDLDQAKRLGRLLLDVVRPEPTEPSSEWAQRAKLWGSENRMLPDAEELRQRFFAGKGDPRAFGWLVAWAMNGFPRLLLSLDQADLFMCTNAGDDPAVMGFTPWSAYTIELPHDALQVPIDGQMQSFDVVKVSHREPDGDRGYVIQGRNTDFVVSGRLVFPLPDWPDDSPEQLRRNEDALGRVRDLVSHLIIGCECEMSDPSAVRAPSTKQPKLGKSLNEPGEHRLSRVVTIACRQSVKEYLLGVRDTSPNRRWLTRGHGKWQPHGARNSLRKWILIAPYWNPKDTSLAVAERPHRFAKGGKTAARGGRR